MTLADYSQAVATYRAKYNGNITSWGRTVAHSIAVGGFDGDPHTWDFGVDMTYDDPANAKNQLCNLPQSQQAEADAFAKSLGLWIDHESDHDHIQPIEWVNHPHSG